MLKQHERSIIFTHPLSRLPHTEDLEIPKVYPSISFSRNQIQSLSVNTFQSSSTLISLDISDNYLCSLPGKVFEPLQVLSTLVLSNNNISSVDPEVRLIYQVFFILFSFLPFLFHASGYIYLVQLLSSFLPSCFCMIQLLNKVVCLFVFVAGLVYLQLWPVGTGDVEICHICISPFIQHTFRICECLSIILSSSDVTVLFCLHFFFYPFYF